MDLERRSVVVMGSLHAVVSRGDLYSLQAVLRIPALDVNARDVSNFTPLMLASFYGFTEGTKELVNKGKADLDLQESHGWTALSLGAMSGHIGIVRFLVESGADTTLADYVGRTAASYSVTIEMKDIILGAEHRRGVALASERLTSEVVIARRNAAEAKETVEKLMLEYSQKLREADAKQQSAERRAAAAEAREDMVMKQLADTTQTAAAVTAFSQYSLKAALESRKLARERIVIAEREKFEAVAAVKTVTGKVKEATQHIDDGLDILKELARFGGEICPADISHLVDHSDMEKIEGSVAFDSDLLEQKLPKVNEAVFPLGVPPTWSDARYPDQLGSTKMRPAGGDTYAILATTLTALVSLLILWWWLDTQLSKHKCRCFTVDTVPKPGSVKSFSPFKDTQLVRSSGWGSRPIESDNYPFPRTVSRKGRAERGRGGGLREPLRYTWGY